MEQRPSLYPQFLVLDAETKSLSMFSGAAGSFAGTASRLEQVDSEGACIEISAMTLGKQNLKVKKWSVAAGFRGVSLGGFGRGFKLLSSAIIYLSILGQH